MPKNESAFIEKTALILCGNFIVSIHSADADALIRDAILGR